MLEIKNIYKTFNPGTINEKKALQGVNLVLEDGDFCTVIGGNGAALQTYNLPASSLVLSQRPIERR